MSIKYAKIITVKLGGSAMDEEKVIHQLAEDISFLLKKKIGFIIVHGGGKEISREMEAKGITPKKIAGLRVTDDATMTIVERAMKKINSQICEIVEKYGVPASPVMGASGLLLCERLPPASSIEAGIAEKVDLGRVGKVIKVNAKHLKDLIGKGAVPIVAPYGIDAKGITLNVNADSAAGSIAGACSDEFVLLTDVDGILINVSGKSMIQKMLSVTDVQRLMRDGVLREGMIPKAEACMNALASGVKRARIVNGLKDHPLMAAFSDESLGTTIVR